MNRLALAIISAAALLAGAAYLNAQVVPAPGPPTGIACAFNTVPPTLTTGQAGWVQCNNAGAVNVSGTISASTTATATAAAPSYVEGTPNPLSQNLSGGLRVIIEGGSALNANGQATMANSAPVTLASDQAVADPCTFRAKSSVAISQATSTVLVAASASNRIYVCSLALVAGAAEIVALTQGTGAVCATSADAIIGSTTVANGMSLAANGGLTLGSGNGTVARGPNVNEDVCLLQDGTDRLAGVMTYVLAP